MRTITKLFLLLCALVPLHAQSPNAFDRSSLDGVLNFEAAAPLNSPRNWIAQPAGTFFLDREIFHGGQQSGRVERTAGSPEKFSGFTLAIPVDFTGKKIELRGFLRMEKVDGFGTFWMREDGDSQSALAFATLQDQHLDGTRDWTEYSISVPVHPDTVRLCFGALRTRQSLEARLRERMETSRQFRCPAACAP